MKIKLLFFSHFCYYILITIYIKDIDCDKDGKIDDDDDDEFGEPRAFATKVAISKITEDILNDIMTTW